VLALTACGASQLGQPGSTDVSIDEVVPSNHHSCTDETGGSSDWVELYNASDADLQLEGYVLTDSLEAPGAATVRLPKVTLPARGVKVFWADGRAELGAAHLAFQLKAEEEQVLLYGPDDSLLDRVDWKGVATDVSWARFPDGQGVFVQCTVPTCGALNGAKCLE
jgi:hypothetical protein